MREYQDGARDQSCEERNLEYLFHLPNHGRTGFSKLLDWFHNKSSVPIGNVYHLAAHQDQERLGDNAQLLDLDYRPTQVVEQPHGRFYMFLCYEIGVAPSFQHDTVEEAV
jgi:hypothetical protein